MINNFCLKMMSIPGYITANVVSLFWSKIFYCLPIFVICAISTLCNISILSIWLCPSTCCVIHFLGLKILLSFTVFIVFVNFTVSGYALWTCWLTYFFRVDQFYYFFSFRNFHSFRNFVVSGYALQICCWTPFSGINEFYYFLQFL